ncbi:HDOD domain-containing protein [Caldifermentibacillus hisashii]|uniref:EAL and HDOD domain-containing protein n=1 Tax=Caldifermentibacillus hisashii TaxID=996558 RepID=UPI0031019174
METFVARQPIYDINHKIYGYELLFRKSIDSHSADSNDDSATADVLVTSFLNFDLDELTNHTFCFINFTENLLLNGTPENFPPSKLVIEILETVYPTEEIISACQKYKSLGYKIALDDYQLNTQDKNSFKILPFVDLIKVDFRTTGKEKRKQMLKLKDFFSIQFLAEKVETEEEYLEACAEGFDYFQGYYFQKPVVLSQKDIPTFFHNYMLLIEETRKPEPNIDYLAKIIESDLSFSFKLLKLINNHYQRNYKIESIKQAIMILGLKEFRRWLYILSIRDASRQQDPIIENLIHNSLVRGKFCETLAKKMKIQGEPASYFLTGMFSLIDEILQTPMTTLVKTLPLKDEIIDALIGKENQFQFVLALIIAIELTNWDQIGQLAKKINVSDDTITESYLEAIKWSNQFFSEEGS